MLDNLRTILAILSVGLVTGILFSYLTQGSVHRTSTFVALATVQGAFVGIVFSIFILASQVNATEFSPLTLEQLSESNAFIGLLSFYTLSILFDVYVIQVQGLGVTAPDVVFRYLPGSWNYTVGIASGLASISIFSLILSRRLLVSLTSPETLLKRTSDKITESSLLKGSDTEVESDELKPERTPLLTIERILSASDERDDEYTVQLSIYYMYKSINDLLKSQDGGVLKQSSDLGSNLKFDIILARWETCVDHGIEGPLDRRLQVFRIQRKLIQSFIESNQDEIAEKQIEVLTDIFEKIFEERYFETDLLQEYKLLSGKIIEKGSTGVLTKMESEVVNIPRLLLDFDGELGSSQREVISKSISLGFEILCESVYSESVDSSDGRILAQEVFQQTNGSLTTVLSQLEQQEDSTGLKQNILNDVYRTLLEMIEGINEADQIIFERLIIATAEVAIALGKDASDLNSDFNRVCEDMDELDDNLQQFKEKIAAGNAELRELTVFSHSGDEMRTIIDGIEKDTS